MYRTSKTIYGEVGSTAVRTLPSRHSRFGHGFDADFEFDDTVCTRIATTNYDEKSRVVLTGLDTR